MIAFPSLSGAQIRTYRLDGAWTDPKKGDSQEVLAENANLSVKTIQRAEHGAAGRQAIVQIARALKVAPVNLFDQREVDQWLAGRMTGPANGRDNAGKAGTTLAKQEKTMTTPLEILEKFDIIPNEYSGLSFEITFRNRSPWRDGKETLNWYPLSPTHSHALFEATPGSTIHATVRLMDLGDDTRTVFASGKNAKSILDAPLGATIRARVKTVYTTAVDDSTRYDDPHDRSYEEVKGLFIREILEIDDSPEAED